MASLGLTILTVLIVIGLMGLITGVVGSLLDGEKPVPREADR